MQRWLNEEQNELLRKGAEDTCAAFDMLVRALEQPKVALLYISSTGRVSISTL